MKIEVLVENLNKSLGVCSRVISSKPSNPILSNVHILAEQNQIVLESASMDMGTKVILGGKVIEQGSFTVPAKTLAEIVSSLPPGKLELEKVDGQLVIKSGKFSAKINGVSSTEWPKLMAEGDSSAGSQPIVLETGDFLKLIPKVVFSAASDDSRPVLTGVLFNLNAESSKLVATDGFRLSVQVVALESTLNGSYVVPVRVLAELVRLVGSESKKITLELSNGLLVCRLGDILLWARLIEGNFPAYEKIIPQSHGVSVAINREELLRAVKTAGIFGRENSNIIKIKVQKESVVISGQSAQTGENSSEIDSKVEGLKDEFTVAFNYHYLLDLLSLSGGEEVVLGLNDPLSAVIFKFTGDPNFLHLIMPVRITG